MWVNYSPLKICDYWFSLLPPWSSFPPFKHILFIESQRFWEKMNMKLDPIYNIEFRFSLYKELCLPSLLCYKWTSTFLPSSLLFRESFFVALFFDNNSLIFLTIMCTCRVSNMALCIWPPPPTIPNTTLVKKVEICLEFKFLKKKDVLY